MSLPDNFGSGLADWLILLWMVFEFLYKRPKDKTRVGPASPEGAQQHKVRAWPIVAGAVAATAIAWLPVFMAHRTRPSGEEAAQVRVELAEAQGNEKWWHQRADNLGQQVQQLQQQLSSIVPTPTLGDRLTGPPTTTGVLLTKPQIGALANLINEKCRAVNCKRPEVDIVWRPHPDSLERAYELRSIFQHGFWAVYSYSGQPVATSAPATVTDRLWWDTELNGPGVVFFFPDGDFVAQAFYEELHSIAPSIRKANQDKGWKFYVVGDNEQ